MRSIDLIGFQVALIVGILTAITIVPAQTLLVDCVWTSYCDGDTTLVHEGDCDVYGESYMIYDNFSCPDGCVVGAGQYGDDCLFNETQCYSQELGELSFISQWNYGIGGIMMLIGAAIIVETFMRDKDKKRRDFFGVTEA